MKLQWAKLLVVSAVLIAALAFAKLPAAFLLGPMIAAIGLAVTGCAIRVPRAAFIVAQGVVGALIARGITLAVFGEIAHNLPIFVASVAAVIVASAVLGMLLARFRLLPGTTAIWASAPGAATAMVLMAERYGADVRLVAVMQYLRLVLVAVVASLFARFAVPAAQGGAAPVPGWFAAIDAHSFVFTLIVIVVGAFAGTVLRVPAGALLATLVLAAFAQDIGALTITLPLPLLAVSYALIGWTIGLTFTRDILVYAFGALPRIAGSILVLIAICAGFGAILSHVTGVAPLTAFLATSPGGADSVAIIATSSKADVPFIMAMQVARFLTVAIAGPFIATNLARWATPKSI